VARRERTRRFTLLLVLASCVHRPVPVPTGTASIGPASYYGSHLHGRLTANGTRYDERAFTCAHRTLPFGTRLRVTAVDTGASTVVVVTDRGPFVAGRIIDLSRAAARALGILEQGVARVRIEILPQD